MLGQTISHYKITDKLGAGGMGVVYKALDCKLERTVALKFLPADVAVSDGDKENLLREARAASALDHPNIGVIYGLEESGDHQVYIVMGYYEGETLAQKLSRGPIPLRESLDLAIQITSGLSAAHARNIVHRDVKPSNIIVTKDHIAKIVDFGLARVVASSRATQSLQVSGTLPYMAPEQVLGEPIGQCSDVWALGVILVQMVTGSHPFLRENTAAMTFAILNQPPAALEVMPPLLQPIAYRALSKKPEHRYPGAKEMLAGLETARSQITATPMGTLGESATLTSAVSANELHAYVERASMPRWQTAAPQKPAFRRGFLAVGAAALLAAASLLLPPVRERLAGLLMASRENHIAVLPFDNLGNDPANQAVTEGMMDSLTSKLSNLNVAQESLWVVPASVVRSRGVTDPSAAFRELGVTMVVKGSIQREGQNVHLTVNLIDTRKLRQIGSAALEDRAGDLAALQDDAVAHLARLMNINVTPAMLRATGGSVAPAAYEPYLKALGYKQRYDKPGMLELAITELNNAVHTDPKFALGYATLADIYRIRYALDPNPKWIEEATANASRAAQLDDHLPAVFVTLGRIHGMIGKHDLAVQEFQHALQLNPRDADALAGMAGAYERMGRFVDAEATFQKATALRPDFWDGYNMLGMFYTRRGKNAEAIAEFRRVIELTPDNAPAYLNLASVYLNMGDARFFTDAEQALNKSIGLSPSYPAYANLGLLYYNEKRYRDAAAMTEKALSFNDKDYRVWSNLVAAYEWLKENDKAAAAREQELKLVEDLVKLQPQDATAQSELAGLYAERKSHDKAMIRIQSALALSPDDPRVLVNVGFAYEKLGDRPNARRYVDKALQKGFPFDDLQSDPGLQDLLSDPNFRPQRK
jgi:serine/threonine-protein kinase